MKAIRHVYQPDWSGCGIAVIAMVAGLSYNGAKTLMIKEKIFDADSDFFGTSFSDLQKVLNALNIQNKNRRKFNKWVNIPAKVAIASTNYDSSGLFHWVLFIRDINGFYIYDPAKRRKKIRDLRGKMTGWFIEVL
jgi:ABC-type bacteriocin/lantibiotic exporter with double-glycine peptidase domain